MEANANFLFKSDKEKFYINVMSATLPDSETALVALPQRLPRQSLKLIEALFDCLHAVAFFAKDRAGGFVAANPAFVRLLRQADKSAILGKSDLDFFPRHIATGYQADDQGVMGRGEPLRHKLELVPTDDLSLEWREANKFPIVDEEGTVVGLAGITVKVSGGYGAHLADPRLAPVLDFIARHYGERIRVEALARLAGMSPRTLERCFHDSFQSSPLRYLKQVRINAASHALGHTHKPIAEIAVDCGFSDQSHLCREFSRLVGETPRRFRQRIRQASRN